MAEFLYCLAKLTLYVHICHACDGLYGEGNASLLFLNAQSKTTPTKPIRSQSYIGPTTVGPDMGQL